MLRGYFDASWSDKPHYQAVTLAGLSASEKVWPDFERAWAQALGNLGLEHWHTSDMRWRMRNAEFQKAVFSLLRTIMDFRDSPMVSYRATVLLEDYRRAKREFPGMMRPEALCVDGCIGNLVYPTEDDFPAILYFDRGEPFRPLLEDVWRKRRKTFDRDWSRQIEAILTTDGTECGIQAADLLAWIQPRYDGLRRLDHPPASERQMMMSLSLCAHLSAHPTGIVYDYDRIVAAYQRRQSK